LFTRVDRALIWQVLAYTRRQLKDSAPPATAMSQRLARSRPSRTDRGGARGAGRTDRKARPCAPRTWQTLLAVLLFTLSGATFGATLRTPRGEHGLLLVVVVVEAAVGRTHDDGGAGAVPNVRVECPP
jgi:hypothetical protein